MTDDVLIEHVRTTRQEMFGLRFRQRDRRAREHRRPAPAKRDLARALTIARERGIDLDRELSR